MAQTQRETYDDMLFKEILPYFIKSMPVMELRDCPCISSKLTTEEMQKIGKKCDQEGNNAGARLLLESLKRHDHWFQAILDATQIKDLKIEVCKDKFEQLKAKVDRAWRELHPLGDNFQVCNPSVLTQPQTPTQVTTIETDTSAAKAPVPVQDVMTDDFKLLVGLQTDTAMEVEETDAPLAASPQTALQQPPPQEKEDKERGGQSGWQEQTAQVEEQYTEARSSGGEDTYHALQPRHSSENEYTQLTDLCLEEPSLEKDACPVPEQASDAHQQEVGEGRGLQAQAQPQAQAQAQPQAQASRRRHHRPQTREEHPSLKEAISNNPHRDFEERDVCRDLDTLSGWSRHQEEHKVIQLIRPHFGTDGYFVLWFWKLAKRPTICVARGGRVITFVVHKSATRNRFYINRHQRTSDSLRTLLEFHCQHGIQYTPQGGQETLVQLSHPHRGQ